MGVASGQSPLQATSSIQVRPTQPATQIPLDSLDLSLATAEERAVITDLKKEGVRALQVQALTTDKPVPAVEFTKVAFNPNPNGPALYLGAKEVVANNNFAVTKVAHNAAGDTLIATPLTPENTTLNGAAALEKNPLFGKQITNLTLAGSVPVVTLLNDKNVYAITNPVDGSTVVSTVEKEEKDAPGFQTGLEVF